MVISLSKVHCLFAILPLFFSSLVFQVPISGRLGIEVRRTCKPEAPELLELGESAWLTATVSLADWLAVEREESTWPTPWVGLAD